MVIVCVLGGKFCGVYVYGILVIGGEKKGGRGEGLKEKKDELFD